MGVAEVYRVLPLPPEKLEWAVASVSGSDDSTTANKRRRRV
jgi:hypothetical protein